MIHNYEKIIKSKVLYGPFGNGGVVEGYVKPSFPWDQVVVSFEENFALNLELGAQLCVYHGGENVIDISGHSDIQIGYSRNTLQNVFSSGKNVEAICIAMRIGSLGIIS